MEVSFAVGATHAPPASAEVSVWDGGRYVPVEGARTGWATEPDAPPVITFDAVRGIRLRLLMAGAHPGEAEGALRISRLEAPTSG